MDAIREIDFGKWENLTFEEIAGANPEYSKYCCVWAFEHPEEHPELDTVMIDSAKYFRTALKAKYWVTNTNIERGLKFKKKKQVYINTWHGIALKHIGNDCPGRNDYNFDTVDHLVVSGSHDERVWKSAFNANPCTYLRCGMPRNEELWLASENKREELPPEQTWAIRKARSA